MLGAKAHAEPKTSPHSSRTEISAHLTGSARFVLKKLLGLVCVEAQCMLLKQLEVLP